MKVRSRVVPAGPPPRRLLAGWHVAGVFGHVYGRVGLMENVVAWRTTLVARSSHAKKASSNHTLQDHMRDAA